MNFRKYGFNETNAQSFDKEKITITQCGQTINMFDKIQAANIDTDIKEVLKKYHCTTDVALEIMQKRGGLKGVYDDISKVQEKIQNVGDLLDFKDYVQNEFEKLPLEIRQKYGNNPKDFLTNAEKEFKKLSEPISKPEKGVTDNANQQ